ncbi:MAG: radical SAM protein [Promethearchaeota archaeon]
MAFRVLVVDALAAGKGRRSFTRDFIGAGPRVVAGLLEGGSRGNVVVRVKRAEEVLTRPRDLASFDALCVSAMSVDLPACRKLATLWRKAHRRRKPLLVGGPVTADSRLRELLDYDFAARGEGESFLGELGRQFERVVAMDGTLAREHPNLHFRDDEKPLPRVPRRLTRSEWNVTPPQTAHVRDYVDFRSARVIVECVRGCSNYQRPKIRLPGVKGTQEPASGSCPADCPGCEEAGELDCRRGIPPGCAYCATIGLLGPPKSRDVGLVVREVKELLELGVRKVVLGASDLLEYGRDLLVEPATLTTPTPPPGPNHEAIEQLVENLRALVQNYDDVKFFVENVKATLVTERALDALASLPVTSFSLGVETGDPTHAAQLGRPGDPRHSLEVVKLAKAKGFSVHAYFIHSLPGTSFQVAKATIALMKKLAAAGVDKITIYKFRPLPGTYFALWWERASREERQRVEKLGREVRDVAIAINLEKKRKWVGKMVELDVVEPHSRQPGWAIGRPVGEGPLVALRDGLQFVGRRVRCRIVGVLSDKLLEGVFALKDDEQGDDGHGDATHERV